MAYIDVRGTIPFPRKRLYFVFAFGRDRREEKLIVQNERRRTSPLALAFFGATVLLWVLATSFVLSVGVLYMAKMGAGIDLVDGAHPLPALLAKLGFCH